MKVEGAARASCLVLLLLATPVVRAQDRIAFETLTVPSSELPQGCRLSSLNESRIVPISTNPWLGDDLSIVAAIREHVATAPRLPDAPLLSKSELARFRLQLAADVRGAYMAVYTDETMLVPVFAVRFDGPAQPRVPRPEDRAGSVRIVRDDTVILVGGSGTCFNSVATFIKSALLR